MKFEITGTIEKTEHEGYCRSYYTWEINEDKFEALEKALRCIGDGKRVKVTVEELNEDNI
jgi:hypothetical protein